MANPKPKKQASFKQEVYPTWDFLTKNFGSTVAMNLYPPYMGAGVTVEDINEDFTTVRVKLALGPLNKNYVGTQFGGSLYSMTDPFYMFILMTNLGEDYIVWDKSATIDFIRPGETTVRAEFHISQDELEEIRQIVAAKKKTDRIFEAEIKDEAGNVVARVKKTLYIRRIKK